jgi:hypothetical protein
MGVLCLLLGGPLLFDGVRMLVGRGSRSCKEVGALCTVCGLFYVTVGVLCWTGSP